MYRELLRFLKELLFLFPVVVIFLAPAWFYGAPWWVESALLFFALVTGVWIRERFQAWRAR